MPRKWTNSKGINVFSERTAQRSINFIKKEVNVPKEDDKKKQYKPRTKNKGGR